MVSNISYIDLTSQGFIFLKGIYHAFLEALLENHKSVSGSWLQNPQLDDSRCILVNKFYIRQFAPKIIHWHVPNVAKWEKI